MKIVFGLSMLVLAFLAVEGQSRDCPKGRSGCICTLEYNPVCSKNGCTYSNLCALSCAGAPFWYFGECLPPYKG